MNSANRVIKNTVVSYVALVVRMLIGLVTVRVVLNTLGETDYGIYMLVAGVVAMLDFLTTSMSGASRRFFAYSLGKGDIDGLKKTFGTTLYIHYGLALLTAVLLEVGGWFFFEYLLNIPSDRIFQAKVVYQLMIVTTIVTIISVPYDAITTAHEDLYVLSLYGILSNIINLGLVLLLLCIPGDKLIWYGLFNMSISVLMRVLKTRYSYRHYFEVRNISLKLFDKNLFTSIFSYTGWNLFGTISGIAITKVRGVLINMFFGVKLNASEGISRQVLGIVNNVATSMTTAIDPQIMKSEGAGDRKRMLDLTAIGSKYSAFLFALLAIPVFFEIDYLLKIWLGTPPEYAALFVKLIIIYQLIEKFTFQITRSIRAVGDIKKYTIFETIGSCIYLPFAYLWFKMGGKPESVYYLTICTAVIVAFIRFYYGNRIAGLNVWHYIKETVVKVIVPIAIACPITYFFVENVDEGWIRLLGTVALFWFSFTIFFWIISIDKNEKVKWKRIFFSLIDKFKFGCK